LVAVGSAAYFAFAANRQNRDFFPKTLDDQAYVIQARMLAQGKLWMPQHECADFFDSFHMLSRPKYASAYFPGTALLYAPLIWLGLPVWVGPVIGAVAGEFIAAPYQASPAASSPSFLTPLMSRKFWHSYLPLPDSLVVPIIRHCYFLGCCHSFLSCSSG
jgi:hypothetical protein